MVTGGGFTPPASPSVRYSIGGVYLKYQRLKTTVTIPTGIAKAADRSPGRVTNYWNNLNLQDRFERTSTEPQ